MSSRAISLYLNPESRDDFVANPASRRYLNPVSRVNFGANPESRDRKRPYPASRDTPSGAPIVSPRVNCCSKFPRVRRHARYCNASWISHSCRLKVKRKSNISSKQKRMKIVINEGEKKQNSSIFL